MAGEREAKCYVVMGLPRYGQQVWREWARAFTPGDEGSARGEAIKTARGLLDGGQLKAASVQGRAVDGHPTPHGEVQVYRGVAEGYSPSLIWPVDSTAEQTVERRGY